MKKVIQILLLLAICIGCCPTRIVKSSDAYQSHEQITDKNHFEQLYFELRDSLINIKAPTEKSESHGLQHSFLQTSLAMSTAGIDSLGDLYHSIENKDSIRTVYKYKNVYHTIYDTLKMEVRDTISVNKTEFIERQLSGVQKFQLNGFWILLGIVAIYIFIRIKFK